MDSQSHSSLWTLLGISVLGLALAACSSGGGGGGGSSTVTLPPGHKATIVAQSTIPIGTATCSGLGGVHLDWGIDTDGDSVLDPGEITGGGDVCNGVGSGGVRQLVVPGPDIPWVTETWTGSTYEVTKLGSTTWDPIVGKNNAGLYWNSGEGPQYFYDAYLLTNATDAPLSVDFAVTWVSDYGTLTLYSGGFDPAHPTTHVADWNESDGYEVCTVECSYSSANLLSLNLGVGESKVMIVSDSYAGYASGYTVYLTSSTKLSAATAQAGVSGTAIAGNISWYKVTGLQPGGSYDVTVHMTAYTHGDAVNMETFGDALWTTYNDCSTDVNTGDCLVPNLQAGSTGILWPAVYQGNIVAGGAYTLKLTPGAESKNLYNDLGVPTAGSVNKGTSTYYIRDPTLANATAYTVNLTNVSDAGVTATINDNLATANPATCGAVSAGTLTCNVTTTGTGYIGYLLLMVDGSATAAGATYTVTAAGPSSSGTALTFNTSLSYQYVSKTNPVMFTAAPAVAGGSYRAWVHPSDATVTGSLTDNGTGGTGSCAPIDAYGNINCTRTAGAGATALSLTVNGSATAVGSDFDVQVSQPTSASAGLGLGNPYPDAAVNTTAAAYTFTVWPGTTYTLTLSGATHNGIVATWGDGTLSGQSCPAASGGTLICSITTSLGSYPMTLTVTVDGSATPNGAWYSVLVQ